MMKDLEAIQPRSGPNKSGDKGRVGEANAEIDIFDLDRGSFWSSLIVVRGD